jgi:hypothetical protein
MPLIIILQKAMCNADLPKRGVLNAFKGIKVFKKGCTLGYSKEKAQIEALFRKEISIVYPANLKAPLPNSSDAPISVSYHFARKILINSIIDYPILMKCIGLKPCSESSIPVLIPVKDILCISVSINIYNNCLLLEKMNL